MLHRKHIQKQQQHCSRSCCRLSLTCPATRLRSASIGALVWGIQAIAVPRRRTLMTPRMPAILQWGSNMLAAAWISCLRLQDLTSGR